MHSSSKPFTTTGGGASSYGKKEHGDPALPRKREYRAFTIKETTLTVPAALLKVEHEYFNTVKDQEKIIMDQV